MKKFGLKHKIWVCIVFLLFLARFGNVFKRVLTPIPQKNPVVKEATIKTTYTTTHFENRVKPIQHLVIHSFALPLDDFLKKLDKLRVSVHYIITPSGEVIHLVPEDKVAWHAGVSFWRGHLGLNPTSIGIELQSETLGQSPFPKEQLDAFKKLALKLIKKHKIDPKNIVAHSDIAPTRKADVGKAFPWEEMAQIGIGLWPSKKEAQAPLEKDIKILLKEIGYDVFDVDKALLAFERRFMPDLVLTNTNILEIEKNLLKQKPIYNKDVLKRLNEVAEIYK